MLLNVPRKGYSKAWNARGQQEKKKEEEEEEEEELEKTEAPWPLILRRQRRDSARAPLVQPGQRPSDQRTLFLRS